MLPVCCNIRIKSKKKKLCNKTNIYPAYISKHKSNFEKNRSSNDFNWNYLMIKKLPVLIRRITSANNGDYFCPNCLFLKKLELHRKRL